MRPSLTPSEQSSAVADSRGSDRERGGIKFKEKRLDARLWRCKGEHQKGSHFPICVFTNNVGRRSPEKLEERRKNKCGDHGEVRSGGPKARKKDAGLARKMQICSKVGSRDREVISAIARQGSTPS